MSLTRYSIYPGVFYTMATPRQVSANRKNTEKSARPKSTIGKNTFHLNALRNILTAKEQILPGESRADFDLLEVQFYEEFPPENGLEDFLLGQLIACAWRLRRVAQVESGVFQHFQELIDNPPPRIVGIAGVSGEDYLPFDDGRGTDAGGGGAANWPTPGSRTDSEDMASSAAAAAEAGATENSSGAGQASRAAQSGVTLPPEHSRRGNQMTRRSIARPMC